MSLRDKLQRYGPWALVAGASEGLGEAFADTLASKGLNVVLVARRREKLAVLCARLADDHGVETMALPMDLSDPDTPARIDKETQSLDVGLMVYNAGYSKIGPFLETPLAEHRQEVAVNCAGPLAMSYLFADRMRARDRSGIVLMSSLSGFQGSALIANYAATKAYNLVLAEGLWEEFREDGIDVLGCVAGATRTPNYEASEPAKPALFAPPVMTAKAVVEEGLGALGKRPSVVTGLGNRLATLIMTRALPRKMTVGIMGRTMRSLYGTPRD